MPDFLDEARAEPKDETKAALRKALRDLDSERRRKAELVEAVYRAASEAAAAMDVPPVPKPPRDRRKGAQAAILLLSDWQFGKRTPEYDSEVAKARIRRFADEALRIIDAERTHRPVDEARIYLLGDLVEGELVFPGQAHRIDASLYRQVFDGAELLVDVIRRVAASVPVRVRGVVGNHGDVGGRSRREMHPETNADAMLMNVARLYVPEVDFPEPVVEGERAWHVIDEVKGKRWFLVHGNQIRSASYGIPWYGFRTKALGWHSTFGPFDYLASGHWHQMVRQDINGIEHFGAGSPESANTYAQEWMAGGGQQGKQMLLFQSEDGLGGEFPIRL